jgi:hypothetical protein
MLQLFQGNQKSATGRHFIKPIGGHWLTGL